MALRPVNRDRSTTSPSAGLNTLSINDAPIPYKQRSSSESGSESVFSATSPSGVLVPHSTSPFYSNPNSSVHSPFNASSPALSNTLTEPLEPPPDFSLARYNTYAQGEQRLAEVRLAKWATDLQRSLRNERERFASLQASERAKWLLERVSEEVRIGNIGLLGSPGHARADWAVIRSNGKEKDGGRRYETGRLDGRDPLGILGFSDEVKRRGTVLVKVFGGVSIVAATVVAVAKACGVASLVPQGGGAWSWLTRVK